METTTLTDPETVVDWESFFLEQAVQSGHGSGYFKGQMYQRGRGLGNIFRGIFKFLMPMAKSVAKSVGKQALDTGVNIFQDTMKGENLKSVVNRRGREAVANLADSAAQRLRQSGKGIKGVRKTRCARKKPVNLGVAKRQKKGDLFDNVDSCRK